ncbi:MAG: DUF2807 domain-containing protein [Flavobacterium sp.]|nr:DUF2807 domain-containing protein [Flavobacterium sp.]
MIKIIIQITKIVIAIVTALLFQSCINGSWNKETISGNGNVATTTRTVTNNFNAVHAKTGLDIRIEQGNTTKIEVQADENLQEHIFTEVKNGILTIYSDANILNSEAQKVYITVPNLNKIKSSSGANVKSENKLNFEKLVLDSSSGSLIEIEVASQSLSCESSSGSSIIVKGKTNTLDSQSSSGSTINLEELIAEKAKANSSSGSSTIVNVTNDLNAHASSGSSISYVSKPNSLMIDESSGGSVTQN